MDSEKTNNMIANLASKKQQLQDQISKKREIVLKFQNDIADLEEKSQQIENNISNIKLRAEKEASMNDRKKSINNDKPKITDVEEDAAITTGAMDVASISTGGDFGGWRHYSKVGDTVKRTPTKKKKIRKIVEFMESVFDSIENGDK